MQKPKSFHISGPEQLVRAAVEVLKEQGYKVANLPSTSPINRRTYDSVSSNWNTNSYRNCGEYEQIYISTECHKPSVKDNVIHFNLPQDWHKMEEYCKQALVDVKKYFTPKEPAKVALTDMSSKNLSIIVTEEGKVYARDLCYDIKDVINLIIEFADKKVDTTHHIAKIDSKIQCIRIGCVGEDVRFSLNELRQIRDAYIELVYEQK